ncbi:MAG: hypothetical protein QM610_03530 [Chitinophagaceae bacterium]
MNFYRILRDNKELGPFSLDDLKKMGLRSSDLIWIDSQSAAWRFPDEVPGLLGLIESADSNSNDSNFSQQGAVHGKPKKRYRLTADHRMVEITEEEARSSDLPRIEEQPPVPKTAPPLSNAKGKASGDDGRVPFQDAPFSKKPATTSNDLPLEPELKKNKKEQDSVAPFQDEAFRKKNPAPIDDTSLPLEPKLTSKNKNEASVDNFVDLEPNNKDDDDMGNNNGMSGNTGAFALTGLLFLVAIGFFGYKWYHDQNNPSKTSATADLSNTDSSAAKTDESKGTPNDGFANSRAMAINDDTLGQYDRRQQRKIQDSLKRLEIAKARLAAREKAKADSIQNALATQNNAPETTPQPTHSDSPPEKPNPATDTAKAAKVNKIRTTEDIGKYVRIGVVQPKAQTAGVSGVKLVVHNINNRNLAKVHINVMYFDNNGNIIKKSDIIAPNITIGNSVTIPVADNAAAAYVSYKVTGLLGDHINLQAK